MAYAVEIYAHGSAQVSDERLAEAGAAIGTDAQPVRFLGSVALPGDELTFWLFDAPSREVVADLLERLGVVPERIVEAVASTFETSSGGDRRPR
jgi:hypothetical protein